jgi:hypothetical protein
MATRQRVTLQQSSGYACTALADPEVLGDLVEADGARAEKQIAIETGGDGWYAPGREQPRHVLYEPPFVLAQFI